MAPVVGRCACKRPFTTIVGFCRWNCQHTDCYAHRKRGCDEPQPNSRAVTTTAL
jgi:hypothetical protein